MRLICFCTLTIFAGEKEMITIAIKSENGCAGFSLIHEGIYEKPSREVCSDIAVLRESLGKLLEKIQNDALARRLVQHLHEMEDADVHPSVRAFARSALASCGYASPAVQ